MCSVACVVLLGENRGYMGSPLFCAAIYCQMAVHPVLSVLFLFRQCLTSYSKHLLFLPNLL